MMLYIIVNLPSSISTILYIAKQVEVFEDHGLMDIIDYH